MRRRTPLIRLKQALSLLFLSAATFCHSTAYAATELVMLEEKGCVYCAKFNREIGEVYPKTTEGKTAPLRRLDLYDSWPADLEKVRPDTVTPTFILVHNEREVGRLRGYQGDEFFWFLLNQLLEKIPPENTDSTDLKQ